MKMHRRCHKPGLWLLGSVLVAVGCNHAEHRSADASTHASVYGTMGIPQRSYRVQTPAAAPTQFASQSQAGQSPQNDAAEAARQLPDDGAVSADAAQTVNNEEAGGVTIAGGSNATANNPNTDLPASADNEGAIQEVNRDAIGDDASFHNRQIPAPRRSFVDLTAQPWYKHAPDYSWLVGQLRYSKTDNCWRLRYASLDENDPYDGEVTLTDCDSMKDLHEGQAIKVVGRLVEPSRRELGTPYKVARVMSAPRGNEAIASGEDHNIKQTGGLMK